MLFLTGNENKVKEARALLGIDVEAFSVDLTEIQTLDVREVTKAKVLEAKKYVPHGTPFFVEDTGLYIDDAHGFPGALVKFMLEAVGVEGIARFARGSKGRAVTVIGYCDGHDTIKLFTGVKKGHFALEPRGASFGWDPVFVPRKPDRSPGELTYGEMSKEEKNKISHRMKAFKRFQKYLQKS